MLKRTFFSLPTFSLWIIIWTFVSWILFFPTRFLSTLSLNSLNLDYSILSPQNYDFQMLVLDAIRNAPKNYVALIIFAFISGLISLLFTIGVLPALLRGISNHKNEGFFSSTLTIFKNWSNNMVSMSWRFAIWLTFTTILTSTASMALAFIGLPTKYSIAILVIQWLFLMSWWTHTSAFWGHGERACLRKGLLRTITRPQILFLATIVWLIFSAFAAGLQFIQLRFNMVNQAPLIFSQFLFLCTMITMHIGKFFWVACHSLPIEDIVIAPSSLPMEVMANTFEQPAIRRAF